MYNMSFVDSVNENSDADFDNKRTVKAVKQPKVVWADDMTETLINAYQIYDCLWNMSLPDYKNRRDDGRLRYL